MGAIQTSCLCNLICAVERVIVNERQITEAFPWNAAPRYMILDRPWVFGTSLLYRPHHGRKALSNGKISAVEPNDDESIEQVEANGRDNK
jgi:hypothetical protein